MFCKYKVKVAPNASCGRTLWQIKAALVWDYAEIMRSHVSWRDLWDFFVGSELPQRNAIPSILEHKSVQLPWQVHRWRLGARPVTCFGRRIKSGEIRESNCSIWRKYGEIGELNGIQIQHMEAMSSFESRCRSLLQIFRCSVDRASAILSRHQRSSGGSCQHGYLQYFLWVPCFFNIFNHIWAIW